jgi:hypothetical protein
VLKTTLTTVPAVAVSTIPAFTFLTNPADKLPADQMMVALRINGHMSPWTQDPVWSRTLAGFVFILALGLLGYWLAPGLERRYRVFWLSCLTGVLLSGVVQQIGFALSIPLVMQLIALRSTQLLALFTLPLAGAGLVALWRSSNLLWRGVGAALATAPAVLTYPRPWLQPLPQLDLLAVIFIVPLLTALLPLLPFGKGRPWTQPVTVALAGLALLALQRGQHTGAETSQIDAVSNYQAQIWARDNTPLNALFVTNTFGWRTVSERPILKPIPGGLYIYSGSTQDKRIEDALGALFGVRLDQLQSASQFDLAFGPAYSRLDATRAQALMCQFGASYIVRSRSEPLNLDVAYQNDGLTVYRGGACP